MIARVYKDGRMRFIHIDAINVEATSEEGHQVSIEGPNRTLTEEFDRVVIEKDPNDY